MFETYDLDYLYKATIADCGKIISMENVGGCIGYTSDRETIYYETILYIFDSKIIDINNPKRVMNLEIKVPSRVMPITSKNGHLYTVVEDSLVKYKGTITNGNEKVLKRTLCGNKLR